MDVCSFDPSWELCGLNRPVICECVCVCVCPHTGSRKWIGCKDHQLYGQDFISSWLLLVWMKCDVFWPELNTYDPGLDSLAFVFVKHSFDLEDILKTDLSTGQCCDSLRKTLWTFHRGLTMSHGWGDSCVTKKRMVGHIWIEPGTKEKFERLAKELSQWRNLSCLFFSGLFLFFLLFFFLFFFYTRNIFLQHFLLHTFICGELSQMFLRRGKDEA